MAKFNKERINFIATEKDPLANELYEYSKKIKTEGWVLAITVIVFGVVSGIIMIDGAEFQGFAIGLIFASVAFGMILGTVGEVVSMLFRAKANQLNNTYRAEKLIENWMIENTKADPTSCDNNTD